MNTTLRNKKMRQPNKIEEDKKNEDNFKKNM